MNIFWEELFGGLPDGDGLERTLIRLIAAIVMGAIVGVQREHAGKPAGMRTHMLVALGSALFVLGSSASGMTMDGLSRVIQGIATGLGFIGAGTILKRRDRWEVEGLTTAAGIWLTAAAGVAAGMGQIGLALLGVLSAWAILALLGFLEAKIRKDEPAGEKSKKRE